MVFWEPTEDLVSLRDAMGRLMEESMVPRRVARMQQGRALRIPLDAYATDEELIILATVPGADPDEVEITLEGDTLTIKGELKPPLENVDYLIRERLYGPFIRTLQLNVPVEADKAEARFENGVLTLTLPKAQAVRPRVIKVKGK